MADYEFTAIRIPILGQQFEGEQKDFMIDFLSAVEENFKRMNELVNRNFTTVTIPTDFPYAPVESDSDIFINTDSGDKVVNLAAGLDSQKLRIINAGTSNNIVTINPDGSEDLLGENISFCLNDSEVLIITFSVTKGWY
jgi:hypothetical protein